MFVLLRVSEEIYELLDFELGLGEASDLIESDFDVGVHLEEFGFGLAEISPGGEVADVEVHLLHVLDHEAEEADEDEGREDGDAFLRERPEIALVLELHRDQRLLAEAFLHLLALDVLEEVVDVADLQHPLFPRVQHQDHPVLGAELSRDFLHVDHLDATLLDHARQLVEVYCRVKAELVPDGLLDHYRQKHQAKSSVESVLLEVWVVFVVVVVEKALSPVFLLFFEGGVFFLGDLRSLVFGRLLRLLFRVLLREPELGAAREAELERAEEGGPGRR